MTLSSDLMGRIAADPELMRDFEALCSFGGRLAGSESERLAMEFVAERGARASGVSCRSLAVKYRGWRALRAELRLADGSQAACHPLVRSAATPSDGLTAEIVDLGRGTPAEFSAHRAEIAGRFVLVRHELMFAAGTIHRRFKYDMARDADAAGFLIAGPLPGGLVAGSTGREEGAAGIPAAGIAPETAARLARTAGGWARVTLLLDTEEKDAEARTLLFDMPGREAEWVVLSAHVDGHDLSESAIDNASGVAAALAVVRALAPLVAGWRVGLRLAFFSAEEWGLMGSARYIAQLSERERNSIALNINLDSVAGGSRLAALTSGFAALEPFLISVADANGHGLRCVRPLMTNSDHANFAIAGIPALRMVAGFDDPSALVRLVLTAADTRDKVARAELATAAQLAACLTAAACQVDAPTAANWRAQVTAG
jgi:aminopeptidase YwaD